MVTHPGTRVPGSGSASTASPPVGYPVPNFEAGVQLYSMTRFRFRFNRLPPGRVPGSKFRGRGATLPHAYPMRTTLVRTQSDCALLWSLCVCSSERAGYIPVKRHSPMVAVQSQDRHGPCSFLLAPRCTNQLLLSNALFIDWRWRSSTVRHPHALQRRRKHHSQ